MRCPTSLVVLSSLAACAGGPSFEPSRSTLPLDVHSHARPNAVRVRHVSLDLSVDFTAQSLSGRARLDLERFDAAAPLVLDAGPTLGIESVTGEDGGPRPFLLGEPDPILGSALTIPLEPRDRQVVVSYRPRPDAKAMQRLDCLFTGCDDQ